MNPQRPPTSPPPATPTTKNPAPVAADLFLGLLGLWIALALVKFGNPVILAVALPVSPSEAIYQSWPTDWAYGLFLPVLLAGFWAHRTQFRPRTPAAAAENASSTVPTKQSVKWSLLSILAVAWLGWQLLSSLQTVDSTLTLRTLPHFLVCVAAFFIGKHWLPTANNAIPNGYRGLWLGLAGGWFVVVTIGWRQHFGGLAETREFFFSLPDWQHQPPELIAKVSSNRIYSTLVYPNALAGVMILITPFLLLSLRETLAPLKQWLASLGTGLIAAGALGCLVWSGSKAGWLIAVAVTLVAYQFRPHSSRRQPGARWRRIALLAATALALLAFWFRYCDYFARGATSVSARLDYWSVAWSSAAAHPLLGSGPGTFLRVYREGKRPEAEMTRLVHNDYLQQATDSGWVGALLFAALVVGCLRQATRFGFSPSRLGVWLGVLGIAAQSFMEFGLYIPAIAWPWFLGLGVCAQANLSTPSSPGVCRPRRHAPRESIGP